jgi:hypothetical protein
MGRIIENDRKEKSRVHFAEAVGERTALNEKEEEERLAKFYYADTKRK